MKLVTFGLSGEIENDGRLGLMLSIEKQDLVIDLGVHSGQAQMMTDMTGFLRGGDQAKAKAQGIIEPLLLDRPSRKLKDLERSGVVLPLDRVQLYPPIRIPGKIICAGKNYPEHEGDESTGPSPTPEYPIGFIKVSTSLIGNAHPIRIPRLSRQIDYEVELAVIIGKKCKDIKVEEAYEYVAGYSVFNDVSARDVQFSEMRNGAVLMGKNS